MEEPQDGRCSAVYYCPGSDHEISDLYHPSSPPTIASEDLQPPPNSLYHVYNNVRRLLDQDQGNFDQVFVSSIPDKCLARLHDFTKARPTAVLVEFTDNTIDERQNSAIPFLRTLSTDAHSARYQHHVMPFVLLATSSMPDPDDFPGAALETSYLSAGALDTMRSPLCSEAINQLVGHVKEATRPSAHSLGSGMAHSLLSSITNISKPGIATHRPDEILSAQRRLAVEQAVAKWHFPAHTFDMDELTYGALFMLEHILRSPALEPYRLPRAELVTFLLAARRQYKHEREVHYHNWRHAVDVTQSLYCFLIDIRLCPPSDTTPSNERDVHAVERLLSPVDALTLLVSAIGHDVGHPGVNNAFLVACSHQLAHVYNDKSVLENYHCSAYSQLLRRHWPALSSIPHFRSTMISTILATDMQRHFEYMGHLSDLKQKVDQSETDLANWNTQEKEHARELVMALLIKAADISNVARPFDISAQWAKVLMNEFSRQGELESELQIPTCLFGGPPNKEDLLAAAQSQKGFMNLFGFPLFRGISEVMPNVSCTLPELEKNQDVWEQRIAEEKARREALGDGKKSPLTFGSVTKSEVDEARFRKRESEPAVLPSTVPQTPKSPTPQQPASDQYGSPVRRPPSEQRHHLSLGLSPAAEEKRSSTPVLWPSALQLSPTGGSSRRSSKDVALNSLQQLNAFTEHNIASHSGGGGSRRGSADAGWQMHQNYSGSRRGSKEESLTTILVTSQSNLATRSTPAGSPSKSAAAGKRHSTTKQAATAARYSVPSSRSQTESSVTATTDQQSPTTWPSSSAPTDDSATPPVPQHISTSPAATGYEAFGQDLGGDWAQDMDGAGHSSMPATLPDIHPEPPTVPAPKPGSPRIISRIASGDSAVSQLDSRKSEPAIRQSRSRSRLRGLKFWKRRRDVDGASGESASP